MLLAVPVYVGRYRTDGTGYMVLVLMDMLGQGKGIRYLQHVLDFMLMMASDSFLDYETSLALQLSQVCSLSHHMGLSDTFIAATALIYDIELRTFNVTDFKFIPNIKVSASLV